MRINKPSIFPLLKPFYLISRIGILLWLIFSVAPISYAQSFLESHQIEDLAIDDYLKIPFEGKFGFFVDSTENIPFRVIKNSPELFLPLESNTLANDQAVWLKTRASSNRTQTYYFTLAQSLCGTVFVVPSSGETKIHQIGRFVPRSELATKVSHSQFPVDLNAGESVDFYLKIPSSSFNNATKVTYYVNGVESFWDSQIIATDIFQSLFQGAIWVTIFYIFFLYLTTRDRIYAYYVFYMVVVAISFYQNMKMELTLLPSFGEFPFFLFLLESLASQLIGFSYILLMRYFLKTPILIPKWDDFATWFLRIRLFLIPVVLACNFYFFDSDIVENIINIFEVLFITAFSIRVFLTKDKVAKLFTLGSFALVFLGGISILSWVGIIQLSNSSLYMQAGVLVQLMVFSLGIGILSKKNQEHKEKVQLKLIDQLKENQELQTNINHELEKKVEERTNEISVKNKELNKTLISLKNAQAQLVQSEKMISLGQLTAGIAHEINNPINFVHGNISPLRRDFEDVKDALVQIGEIIKESDDKDRIEKYETLLSDFEMDFLAQEIQSLLDGIQEGAERTKEIVSGLKNFSRSSEIGFKPFDLTNGLDVTLTLLKPKLQGKIKIEKDYQFNGPVDCMPGKMNQVFLNLLDNSIQSIEGKGTISISTKRIGENIVIGIKDTGVGMKPEVKKRIFEPFFTTKDIGVGTGLGLSITFGIIKKHLGSIQVESELGKGTFMKISIPRRQEEKVMNPVES